MDEEERTEMESQDVAPEEQTQEDKRPSRLLQMLRSGGSAAKEEVSNIDVSGFRSKQHKTEDLFEVPKDTDADIYAQDLLEPPPRPDVSDLVTVSKEQMTGYKEGEMDEDMDDLFETPKSTDSDIRTDDLLEGPEMESVDDLVDVDRDRLMSGESEPHWADADFKRMRRTVRPIRRVAQPSRRPAWPSGASSLSTINPWGR